MHQLEAGLNLLCQADPCAETYLQEETGEHILATAGELHLEQCLKDLRERFTKVDIEVSPPMVPFRETIVADKAINDSFWKEGLNEGKGEGASADGTLTICTGPCKFLIKALPLSAEVASFLSKNKRNLRQTLIDHSTAHVLQQLAELVDELHLIETETQTGNILAIGPRRDCGNLFLITSKCLKQLEVWKDFKNSLLSGFQLAVEQGPLCAEPVMGVAFILKSFEIDDTALPSDESDKCQQLSMLKGQLISVMKDACHRAFFFRSPRLMLAMYSCDIQTTTDVLGRVYSVVSRRMGQILSEEYNEGTGFFTIKSLIPVPESFGFADDIRGKTSGLAIPQLVFHGFQTFDQDPFWVPSTEEELEEFGEVAEKANVALRYLIGVRERKGLFVEKKIVQSAEKQRTLKK